MKEEGEDPNEYWWTTEKRTLTMMDTFSLMHMKRGKISFDYGLKPKEIFRCWHQNCFIGATLSGSGHPGLTNRDYHFYVLKNIRKKNKSNRVKSVKDKDMVTTTTTTTVTCTTTTITKKEKALTTQGTT